jgi:hypothetical protein
MILKDQITNIFVQIDDFCKEFDAQIKQMKLGVLGGPKKRRNRASLMSDSEIITIMIGFHLGAHKTFKHYYQQIVCVYWRDLFPKSLSYNRFVELQQKCFVVFALFLKEKCLGKCTTISFMDSTTLKVCRNQRIHNHKVFKGLAERGKSSMGWFYGFKLHLVCNEKGELLSFYLTKGNVDDRNPKHIKKMTEQLFGKLFADKGYLSKAFWEMLFSDGIQLFTKLRKNMKNHIMKMEIRFYLEKEPLLRPSMMNLKIIAKWNIPDIEV